LKGTHLISTGWLPAVNERAGAKPGILAGRADEAIYY
jgi:hypothetical protein